MLICEPIAVMQHHEAKMIEVNAKLVGFVDIQTNPATFYNEF